MKNTILILMLSAVSLFGQVYTNGVYVQDGKTIEVDKKVHSIVSTTKAETAFFSNELTVRINTNTDLTINSFFQEVDYGTTPQKAKFGANSLSVTMMNGSGVFLYSSTNESSACVISTTLADLELNSGTFYVAVNPNKVLIVVLDGSLKAHAAKKKVTVTAGNALIATPNEIGILEDKISLAVEKVNQTSLDVLKNGAKDVTESKGKYVFITLDTKLVGVNMN